MASKLILAKTSAEAIGAKAADSVFVAGGTEVNRLGSEIAAKAETLISLKKCSDLSGIEEDAGMVRIGAMCTFQQIIESDKTPEYLKKAAYFMASRTKRNMATIGGNIAAFRSDSYLLPVLYAAGAVLEVFTGEGTQNMSIDSYREASEAGSDILITAVTIPGNIRVVSKRYSNTAQSHAVLTMSAALRDGRLHMAGAVKNVGLLHFCDLEKAFTDEPDISEESIIKMVKECTGLNTEDDMFGSDSYKRYLIGVTAFDLHRLLSDKEA